MGGGVASPELAREVCKAGALGTMTASFIPADDVRKGIRTIREGTDRPFSANLLMCPELVNPPAADAAAAKAVQKAIDPLRGRLGLPPKEDVPAPVAKFVMENLQVCLDEKVPVLSVGLGNPGKTVVDDCHKRGMKVTVMVSSVRDAKVAEAIGVDAIVVQGWEAGGHRSHFENSDALQQGSVGTLALVGEVVDQVKVPVIAAGGISDGRGIVAALAMGAAGVQLGTRFVATAESGSSAAYKKALLEKGADDTMITNRASGWYARAIRNEVIEHMAATDPTPIPFPLQLRLQRDLLELAKQKDDARTLHLWAGQGVGKVRDIPGAGEVVQRLVAEAIEVLRKRLPQAIEV